MWIVRYSWPMQRYAGSATWCRQSLSIIALLSSSSCDNRLSVWDTVATPYGQKIRTARKGEQLCHSVWARRALSGAFFGAINGAHCEPAGNMGELMEWARILAYISGTVDQELLLRNEYLA